MSRRGSASDGANRLPAVRLIGTPSAFRAMVVHSAQVPNRIVAELGGEQIHEFRRGCGLACGCAPEVAKDGFERCDEVGLQ